MINHNIKQFDNGLRLIEAPNDQTQAVTVFILVGIGGRFEADGQKGISHFLEHLFFKGSKNRPSAFEISRELDAIGANYNAFTGEEYTGFYVQSSRDDALKGFDVISDMFLNPLFEEAEIEREKGVIIQEANMYRDMPQMHVQTLNQKQMFGDHPLGFDLVGDENFIKNATRNDIVEYHRNYLPSNTIVAICGNMKGLGIEEKINDLFGPIQDSKIEKALPYSFSPVAEEIVEEIREVDQAHLALSYLSISKNDQRKYALSILNSILGGSMSSRLFREIREKRGLAYYVKSTNSSYADIGVFSIYAGVKPEKLKEAVEIAKGQIEEICQKGPDENELERAKGNLRGSLAISLEDSLEIANFVAEDMLYFGKIRSTEEIIERINAVTKEEVIDLAKEIFSKGRVGLSIIGPKSYK
ncbi:MAG: Protease 3 precursor [candidate division WS2 bacterium ADurb.Bin280]|uniref:Protease 3 n=1 Tax=candidate division WS2 bacterium ADurb.Bin280 TaxID=1852829 RepID=A0A1V5SCF6_9BACT|nr:MAG: Protease 3 precursor [candidate division WS2 bacterium ADurb.Bin280]